MVQVYEKKKKEEIMEKLVWISVDEKLPSKDDWYLIVLENIESRERCVEIDYWADGDWVSPHCKESLLYWMPIPMFPED